VQVCERVDVEAWRREGVCAHVRQGLEAVSKVWRQSTRSGGGGKVWRWWQGLEVAAKCSRASLGARTGSTRAKTGFTIAKTGSNSATSGFAQGCSGVNSLKTHPLIVELKLLLSSTATLPL